MQQNPHFKHRHSRLVAYLLILVFTLPIAIAYTLYQCRKTVTFKTLEHGTLLSPAIQVKAAPFFKSEFLGNWQLIYVEPQPCAIDCQTRLTELKKIHQALGKEKRRVEYRSLSLKNGLLKSGHIVIIDPKGWLVLDYSAQTLPQDIVKDLRRLLRNKHA